MVVFEMYYSKTDLGYVKESTYISGSNNYFNSLSNIYFKKVENEKLSSSKCSPCVRCGYCYGVKKWI